MTEKRCNRCKIEIDCKYKTCDACREVNRMVFWNRTPEVRQEIREGHAHRYRTDEAWRKKKCLESSVRLKSSVVCSGCDKVFKYGSMGVHRKCCKGRTEKTTLEEILELSLQVCPLIESNDSDRSMNPKNKTTG